MLLAHTQAPRVPIQANDGRGARETSHSFSLITPTLWRRKIWMSRRMAEKGNESLDGDAFCFPFHILIIKFFSFFFHPSRIWMPLFLPTRTFAIPSTTRIAIPIFPFPCSVAVPTTFLEYIHTCHHYHSTTTHSPTFIPRLTYTHPSPIILSF